MGMNYYLLEDICECCHRERRKLHIGKSSFGWTFSFHGFRNEWDQPNIKSWADWKEYLKLRIDGTCAIVDEDGEFIALDTFFYLVESKKNNLLNHTIRCRVTHPEHAERDCWLDDEGNSFSAGEFS